MEVPSYSLLLALVLLTLAIHGVTVEEDMVDGIL